MIAAWRWGTAVRVLLLLVLVTGAAFAIAPLLESPRPQQDLVAELAAGRVDYLEYEQQPELVVHWAAAPGWSWRRTRIDTWEILTVAPSVQAPQVSQSAQTSPSAQDVSAVSWLLRQVEASPLLRGGGRQPLRGGVGLLCAMCLSLLVGLLAAALTGAVQALRA